MSSVGIGIDSWKNSTDITPGNLLNFVDFQRLDISQKLNEESKSELGQFFTPSSVATFMVSLLDTPQDEITLLDPGAGIGSLTAAFAAKMSQRGEPPNTINVTAVEIETKFLDYLREVLDMCERLCEKNQIDFSYRIIQKDFLRIALEGIQGDLFNEGFSEVFSTVILNPPYRKINKNSEERELLSTAGIETSNIYTGFLGLIPRLLSSNGEMVSITPRSFCNGLYFRSFRKDFLKRMYFQHIHEFDARDKAFQEESVLQENIICHAKKHEHSTLNQRKSVAVSSSSDPSLVDQKIWEVAPEKLVEPGDSEYYIRLITDGIDQEITRRMDQLKSSLEDLGLSVSTGKVVPFRSKELLQEEYKRESTFPLIYPTHLREFGIQWPLNNGSKPNAILHEAEAQDLLLPPGHYTLVKRFSAKEEPKRIQAALFNPEDVRNKSVGFENHINVIHNDEQGIDREIAQGLTVFLNSTLVDLYFRQFSGHTQVNATDLENLWYPTRNNLRLLSQFVDDGNIDQETIDTVVNEELFDMAEQNDLEPVSAQEKINQALGILKDLGIPKAQQNERSALTLLALLDLHPQDEWAEASAPLRGITEMMDFFEEYYGKQYAPNTRETVRRQTVHQFLQAGIIVDNPDQPDRPPNSPNYVYQIESNLLDVLRTYETDEWQEYLEGYLEELETLQKKYRQQRDMRRIPLDLPDEDDIYLSPGGQNVLVKEIIDEFCPRFTPGGKPLYVGDAAKKWAYFDEEGLENLGLSIKRTGVKIPDVIVHYIEENWLVLVEAVTSHGPVNPKRHHELKELFSESKIGVVFVTAFLDRSTMAQYLGDIAWETEVWVAENPSHLIHFDGERFLGPY